MQRGKEDIRGSSEIDRWGIDWVGGWVYGSSLARVVGSNPTGGMDVCCECRVL